MEGREGWSWEVSSRREEEEVEARVVSPVVTQGGSFDSAARRFSEPPFRVKFWSFSPVRPSEKRRKTLEAGEQAAEPARRSRLPRSSRRILRSALLKRRF